MSNALDVLERRNIPLMVETRRSGNPSADYNVKGYAAVFNQPSLDLGAFTEIMAPGAFTNVLATGPDVHLLWDHDTRFVLARTGPRAATRPYRLDLQEDAHGLQYWARIAPTSYASDLNILLDGGLIDQASFAFTVRRDTWDLLYEGTQEEKVVRTIHEVGGLFDVTICAQGAYPQTVSLLDEARMISSKMSAPAGTLPVHLRGAARRAWVIGEHRRAIAASRASAATDARSA